MPAQAAPLPVSTPQAEGISAQRFSRVGDFVQALVSRGEFLGAVTLVARNGRIVEWRAYGQRDLARASPMRPDTIFRIYSMTKPVVSVALLSLLEEGRIASLDEPVGKYLPSFADRPITVRNLLTHTSGLAAPTEVEEGAPDLAAYAERAARLAPAASPGARYDYNSINTEIASRIAEVASGRPFDALLRERVFAPLRMDDTGFEVAPANRSRIADMTSTDAGGRLVDKRVGEAGPPGTRMRPYTSGAGGLYSTAGDYARFCQMLLNGGELDGVRVLSRKSVDLMLADHLASFSPRLDAWGDGYGLGVYVVRDPAARGRLGSAGQFGWSGAGGTYFTVDPRERLVAILMTQHLPDGLGRDPPKPSARFYNLIHQSLANP